MRFSITPDNFERALRQVVAVAPTRSTIPLYENVLVEADGNGVRFSAADTGVAIRTPAPAQVLDSGRIAVPARKLLDIVRLLPAAMAEVKTVGETLHVRCGKAKLSLRGLRTEDDFIAIPASALQGGWSIPVSQLNTMIARVIFAASTEESRPILNGVLWEFSPGSMAMVATDGHRLVRFQAPVEGGPDANLQLIVSPKALAQAQRLFDPSKDATVTHTDNSVALRQGDLVLVGGLIEGPYPNYQMVIPRDNDKIAVLDNRALQAALRRVAVVASQQTHRVRFSFDVGALRLSVDTPDLGQANDELEIEYAGEPLEIAFNASYLLDVLRSIPSERVRMSFKTSERASIIEPLADTSENAHKQFALLMPLRLM